jgi:uncharacterized damage-inducible protein DinB
MTGSDLANMYEFSYGVIRRNADGVSQEESLIDPQPAGNSLNWVLGHILAARNTVLSLTGCAPVLDPEDAAYYQRGSDPNAGGKVLDLGTLRGLLEDSHQQLIPALTALSDETLASPLPEKHRRSPLTGTIGDALARLCFHEGYHAGQLGLLRRIVGKEGAIR